MSSVAWWQPPEDPAEGRLRQQDLAVNLRVAWDLIRKEERERGKERRKEGKKRTAYKSNAHWSVSPACEDGPPSLARRQA